MGRNGLYLSAVSIFPQVLFKCKYLLINFSFAELLRVHLALIVPLPQRSEVFHSKSEYVYKCFLPVHVLGNCVKIVAAQYQTFI